MQATIPLEPGEVYHLYNRGNNGENLFRSERDYRHFLELYADHIQPIAETFAYCLMPNHFHLVVRIRHTRVADLAGSETCEVKPGEVTPKRASQAFSNLFNAYGKFFNRHHARTGKLFEERFHRIHVQTESYFMQLVAYVHLNPQTHGFVDDFRVWLWSSYAAFLSDKPTKPSRNSKA